MATYLTKEQIIEVTGVQHFENLVELEILFNSFDEFASLEGCTHLKRLCCIDNGLKRISNLQPLGMTLTTLCLCDQGLTAMDNLVLPNLRELFLHRNAITKIGNLGGCPRLRKLWLFQNQLETVTGLHAVPELSECWLQSNQISKLSGFETLNQLHNLGLAGNQITDFKEMKRLSACPGLRNLSMSDIHFGRCPIADEAGYQEFIVLHLPQVTTLDGISITKETQLSAEDLFYSQLKSFNGSLREVEDSYQQSLQAIEAQYQSRESYSNVLEKEMSAALKELQGLVSEGRGVISHTVARSQQLLTANSHALASSLQELEVQAKVALKEQLDCIHSEFDASAALLSVLEQVALADSELVSILCDAAGGAGDSAPGKKGKKAITDATAENGPKRILFQSISNNTADYQMVSSVISPTPAMADAGVNPKKKAARNANAAAGFEGDYAGVRRGLEKLEIARLYKIVQHPALGNGSTAVAGSMSSAPGQAYEASATYQRVITLLSPEQLQLVLAKGWEALDHSPVFSTDADMIATLYGTVGINMNQALPEEYASVLQAECIDDNTLLHIKNTHEGTSLNSSSSSSNATGRKGAAGGGASVAAPVGTSNAAKLTKLQAALGAKLYLLVCCKLYTEKVSFGLLGDASQVSSMQFPASEDLRRQLMLEFLKSKRPQKVSLQLRAPESGSAAGEAASSTVFLVPTKLCSEAVALDFLALCASPPVEGGGLRSAESRLEPLLLPTNNAEHSAHVLSTFEKKAAEQVRHYIDKLLEEVDEAGAGALRAAEADVTHREGSLKAMRAEVERERSGQDAMLREMRQMALNAEGGGGGGNGSPVGGIAHSFSNANMAPNSGAKPGAARKR